MTQSVKQAAGGTLPAKKHSEKWNRARRELLRHWQLYLVMLLPLVLIGIFSYGPMLGLQIAFKDFTAAKGIWGSPWVGMKHFKNFVTSYQFSRLISNTLGISVYTLVAGFPIPILLALMINECRNERF